MSAIDPTYVRRVNPFDAIGRCQAFGPDAPSSGKIDMDAEVAIVGAGVVGCARRWALARRGVAVAVLEAEAEAGLAASGTNSGILHTGFDSVPGELETELILRSAELRDPVLERSGCR